MKCEAYNIPLEEETPDRKMSVLLMDDDESILAVTEKMLTFLGYRVACARNGHEAIEMYHASVKKGEPFSLLILDLTVKGGMGGVSTLSVIRKYNPGVTAVVSSGSFMKPELSDYRAHGFSGILIKPYRLSDLQQTLNNVVPV